MPSEADAATLRQQPTNSAHLKDSQSAIRVAGGRMPPTRCKVQRNCHATLCGLGRGGHLKWGVGHCCAHSQHSQGPVSKGQAHKVCADCGWLWQPLHIKDASSSIELPQTVEVPA